MSVPVLATKLFHAPLQSGVVNRPRLHVKLNEGLQRKLILISAPAGFGKTTLVSEWIAELAPANKVAWLSLDQADSNPATFFTYLIAALQPLRKDLGSGLIPAIQSSPAINDALLASLINEIAAIPDGLILVLDDYHVLDSEAVDLALTYLLDHLPAQLHLLITSREDPSLPLSRYRAKNQLTEIRAADLRFTPAEAGLFLNQMMHLNLSPESISALDARTEGWITGLQLAALSMRGRSDTTGFIQAFTGSHRFVLDYLVEEVLQHQPEPIRNFLLQTAILDRLCAPLCNAVTERTDGKDMLDTLERSNLFLIPLDDQRQWYRYHHLFAEVLLTHLLDAQPDQIVSLHSRASRWYEDNGLRSDAIHHALAARDFEFAADLIELAWPATEDKTIQPSTWFAWVKSIPEEMLRNRPVLNVDYAYSLLGSKEMESAQARFTDIEKSLSNPVDLVVVDQNQYHSLPATIAIGRAYIAQAHGSIPDTVKYANQARELAPENDLYRRGQASMMLGMSYWASGALKAAEDVFADFTRRLRNSGNIADAIATTVVLADIRQSMGRLHEAEDGLEQLLQYVTDLGDPISPDAADLYRELSMLSLEKGDLKTTKDYLQKSKELGEKVHFPVWRYRWFIDSAQLEMTQGNLDEALHLLDEADRLYVPTPLPEFQPISAIKARIRIRQGRLDKASEWAVRRGLSPDDDLSYLHEFEHLTLVRLLISQYRNDLNADTIQTAVHLLDRLLQAAQTAGRTRSMIEILMMQAIVQSVMGNQPLMRALMGQALALAEPESYVRVFINEGSLVTEFIKPFASQTTAPGMRKYIHSVLAALKQDSEVDSLKNIQIKASQALIEPLSERELDVLKLLGTELSGPEIANELSVSLSTVRTHTRAIFAKLGVNNRLAAIHTAEELNLL